jgi:hypothetical protein
VVENTWDGSTVTKLENFLLYVDIKQFIVTHCAQAGRYYPSEN